MNSHSAKQQFINHDRLVRNNSGFNPHIPTLHQEGQIEGQNGYLTIRNNQVALVRNILSDPDFLARQRNPKRISQTHIDHLGEGANTIDNYLAFVRAILQEMKVLRKSKGKSYVIQMATSYFYRCKFRSAYIVFGIDREDVAKIDKLHEIYREIQSAENFDDL